MAPQTLAGSNTLHGRHDDQLRHARGRRHCVAARLCDSRETHRCQRRHVRRRRGRQWLDTANIASLLAANGGNFASGSFLGIDTTAGNFSYGSAIPGSLGLTKLGANTLTLTGSNSYVGPTSVNQGNLLVNGSLASPVTVNSGGMLGGSGSLTSVTVASDGSLSPGAAPSPMNVSGSLTLVSGAQMDYALDTPADSDEVYMPSGPFVLSGQQFADFNFTSVGQRRTRHVQR